MRASADRWGRDGGYADGNTITASGRHNIGGNILSLLHGSTFTGCVRNLTSTNSCAFTKLFNDNTNLISAENLILNDTLANRCYAYMFYGCIRLNSIECLATNISASGCLSYWVYNVAASGTFVKDANMTSWPNGQDGIPWGWTVHDAA